MSLNIISEVWEALRNHIDLNERTDAADSLISLLIDNNYEPEDIKETFTGNKELLAALKYYLEQHDIEEEYDEEEYDSDDDEWN